MTIRGVFPDKDPVDRLDYPADFSNELESDEVVSSFSVDIDPTGELVQENLTGQGTQYPTVWLSGGSAGTVYLISFTATTNKGTPQRIFNRKYRLRVRDL